LSAPVEVTVFGPRGSGARSLGLHPVEGVAVLVTPSSESDNEAANEIANRIADEAAAEARRQVVLNALRASLDAAQEKLRAARARIADLEAINVAAVTGRRRFFGPVLMVPVAAGDWRGEVWLLDPEKKGRGFGLRFRSVAEVRELHPELWVTTVTADGVLLDAWGGK